MRILNNVAATPNKQQRITAQSVSAVLPESKLGDRVIVKREKPTDISDSAIRAKIEAHKNKKDDVKVAAPAVKDDLVTAMPDDIEINQKSTIVKNEVAKVSLELKDKQKNEDVLLKSDIAKNDPNDSNTQEKLRTILKTGGFSFSQKEKETLASILNTEA